jgi:molecular chaperone IbpA
MRCQTTILAYFKENIMPSDFLDQLLRGTIGYEPLTRWVTTFDGSNYPPYNIEKTYDANIYALTMAVAGFTRDELEVSMEEGLLTISGKKPAQDTDTEFLYRGLSFRDFKRTFQLGKHVEVTSVSLWVFCQRTYPLMQSVNSISVNSHLE